MHGTHHHDFRANGHGDERAVERLLVSPRSTAWSRAMAAARSANREDHCDHLRETVIMLMRLAGLMTKGSECSAEDLTDASNAVQDAVVALLLIDVLTDDDFQLLSAPWAASAGDKLIEPL